tara:strand:- start:267 stop:434 length:168 start_codon:yes stop_codon:yes gene_type:complete
MCAFLMLALETVDWLPLSLKIFTRVGQESLVSRIRAALERSFDESAHPDFSVLHY